MGAFVNGMARLGRLHPVRLDVPHLQRLHAPGDPPRGALAPAVALHLHARQRLPRRGRPDAPAGRALLGAAPHPQPRLRAPLPTRSSARRRGRTRSRAATGPTAVGAHAAEARQHRRARAASIRSRCCAARTPSPKRAGRPSLVIIATGSEVEVAVAAKAHARRERARSVRVVSAPCWEAFERQDAAYRDQSLPPGVKRVVIEIGRTDPWRGVVGLDGLGHRAGQFRRSPRPTGTSRSSSASRPKRSPTRSRSG